MRRTAFALAAALFAAPAAAEVSLGLEASLGAQRLGMQRVPGTSQDLAPAADVGGLTLLLRGGPFMIGAAVERNREGDALGGYDASALAGLATDLLPFLRLELLGELGAAHVRSTSDVAAVANGKADWDRFYGVRPGLSMKLPVLPVRVGAWALARWGLPGASASPELGFLGRVGLEF